MSVDQKLFLSVFSAVVNFVKIMKILLKSSIDQALPEIIIIFTGVYFNSIQPDHTYEKSRVFLDKLEAEHEFLRGPLLAKMELIVRWVSENSLGKFPLAFEVKFMVILIFFIVILFTPSLFVVIYIYLYSLSYY